MRLKKTTEKTPRKTKTQNDTPTVPEVTEHPADTVGDSFAEKVKSIGMESIKTDGFVTLSNMTQCEISLTGTSLVYLPNETFAKIPAGQSVKISRALYKDILKNSASRRYMDAGLVVSDTMPNDPSLAEATSNPEMPESLKIGGRATLEKKDIVGTATL